MNSEKLKEKLRQIRDDLETDHAVRLHRAISWLGCAELYQETDDDITMISLWVAFNACYAIDDERSGQNERNDFNEFMRKLCDVDTDNRIYDLLWLKFSQFVKLIIENRYVFAPFWVSVRAGNSDWEEKFDASKKSAYYALANNRTPVLLGIILNRLYVLRNQLIHGGSTYQGNVNRDQVRDGKRLLLELLPVIVDLMMDHPDENWGRIHYPIIED